MDFITLIDVKKNTEVKAYIELAKNAGYLHDIGNLVNRAMRLQLFL